MNPDPEFLKLASGREIRIEAVHLERTAAGYLEGRPDWDEATRCALSRMKGAWGDRRVHIIEPPVGARTSVGPQEWCVHVWLTSNHASVADAHGSELVVVFFCSHISSWPLGDLVGEEVRELDWDALAKDFWY